MRLASTVGYGLDPVGCIVGVANGLAIDIGTEDGQVGCAVAMKKRLSRNSPPVTYMPTAGRLVDVGGYAGCGSIESHVSGEYYLSTFGAFAANKSISFFP